MWISWQDPSQQGHKPFYVSDATLPFTTNLGEPAKAGTNGGWTVDFRFGGGPRRSRPRLRGSRRHECRCDNTGPLLLRLGVQPLGSSAALLQYDECKSNSNELVRRVQRNSSMENYGLESYEAASKFCCELKPCEEVLRMTRIELPNRLRIPTHSVSGDSRDKFSRELFGHCSELPGVALAGGR